MKPLLRARCQNLFVIMVITIAILAIYWPVFHYPFVDYDDQSYVYENIAIRSDSVGQFLKWAFVSSHAANWHPVTWFSHKLDWMLFQDYAGGHHGMSVLMHIANACLLFMLLYLATGRTWKCALAAILFAVHPLNVESVAWVAERKNVLSTFFGLGTLLLYTRYAAKPSYRTYLPVLFLFAIGLMAKPMLVTLPVIMLLWDYWPLGRFAIPAAGKGEWRRRIKFLIFEKIPLLCLAVSSIFITILAARDGGAMKSWAEFSLDVRIMNAVTSYVTYLVRLIWPMDLAFYYPYPLSFQMVTVILFSVSLIIASMLVVKERRAHPAWVMGWFWYLITLLPVIGLIQVGFQASADRYAYFPLIGIFIVLSWSIPDAWFRALREKIVIIVSPLLVVSFFVCVARQQVTYWRDSKSLATRALQVTERNHIAHLIMGNALDREGDRAGAAAQYREALAGKPDYGEAWNNLGNLFFAAARYEEAGNYYRHAVKLDPDNVRAINNLGVIFLMQGRRDEAAQQFREALRRDPRYSSPLENLRRMGAGAP